MLHSAQLDAQQAQLVSQQVAQEAIKIESSNLDLRTKRDTFDEYVDSLRKEYKDSARKNTAGYFWWSELKDAASLCMGWIPGAPDTRTPSNPEVRTTVPGIYGADGKPVTQYSW